MLQRRDHAQALGVVVETAMIPQASVERALPGMAERRMAEIVRQRQGLGEVLVEPELARDGAGDLRHFQRMGQPGAVVVAFVKHEDLGLVLQPAKRRRMDHPIAVAAKRAAGPTRRLVVQPAAARRGVAGIDRAASRHSYRHQTRSFRN